MSELLSRVDHERECRRYQQGISHTSPMDCDCFIRGIAELFSRSETRIERLTNPHLDARDPDAYTTRGRWAFQVAETLAQDVQFLDNINAKLLQVLKEIGCRYYGSEGCAGGMKTIPKSRWCVRCRGIEAAKEV